MNKKNIFISIFTSYIILLSIMSCHNYNQTTNNAYNSKYRTDTVYNPPYLPGAKRVIYGSGTSVKHGTSGPIYLYKPATEKELDSIRKLRNEIFKRNGHPRYGIKDSLQGNDTIKKHIEKKIIN